MILLILLQQFASLQFRSSFPAFVNPKFVNDVKVDFPLNFLQPMINRQDGLIQNKTFLPFDPAPFQSNTAKQQSDTDHECSTFPHFG